MTVHFCTVMTLTRIESRVVRNYCCMSKVGVDTPPAYVDAMSRQWYCTVQNTTVATVSSRSLLDTACIVAVQ